MPRVRRLHNDASLAVGYRRASARAHPLVERLLRAIATGEPASPSFEDGHRAQLVLDAVLESARRRTWVDVPA